MRLKFPLKIEFEITSSCNLKCKHCMLNLRDKRELDSQKIKRLIDEWIHNGLLELQLTGGEPLLRSDLLDIIEYARSRGLKVLLSTNGMLITDKFAEKFGKLGAFIEISLDGSNKEVHNKIRNSEIFDYVIQGIEKLKYYNNKIMIETVIQKDNFDDLENIHKLACRLGAYRHLFHNLRYTKKDIIKIGLTNEEQKAAQDRIFHLRKTSSIQVQPPYLPVDSYWEQQKSLNESKIFGCGALKFKCGVAADGGVFPCLLFSDEPDFLLGNVNDNTIYDIWNAPKSKGLFSSFHERGMPLLCSTCKAKDHCDGGCRKVAYKLNGDVHAQDISCPYAVKLEEGTIPCH